VNPNIGFVLTAGQLVTSAVRAADQPFISSEVLGSDGRARGLGGLCFLLADLLRGFTENRLL
jgi:hypothetical protein